MKDERAAMPVHEELKQRGTISDIPSPPQRELVTARPVRACACVCSINAEHNQIWGKSVSDTVRSTEISILLDSSGGTASGRSGQWRGAVARNVPVLHSPHRLQYQGLM